MKQKPIEITDLTVKHVHNMLGDLKMRPGEFLAEVKKMLGCSKEQARWLMQDMMDWGYIEITTELKVAVGNGESQTWP